MSSKSILFYLIFILFVTLGCRKEKFKADRIQGIWKLVEVSDSSGVIPDSLLRPAYYEFYDCKSPRTKSCSGVLLLKDTIFGDFTVDFLWGITNNSYITTEVAYLKIYSIKGAMNLTGFGKKKKLRVTKDAENYFLLEKVESVTTSY